jgi:hypothetical protein
MFPAMAIKLSAQELAHLGEPSIALKDGSGYLAEMAVFHELHCIVSPSDQCRAIGVFSLKVQKRIRRHLHLDYYYGNMTADEEQREAKHMGRWVAHIGYGSKTNI